MTVVTYDYMAEDSQGERVAFLYGRIIAEARA